MAAKCRKCNIVFDSLGEVRKHQWAVHREMFDNAIKRRKRGWIKGKKRTQESLEKFKKTMALKKAFAAQLMNINNSTITPNLVSNGEMTARELLDKLKDQQRFINDTVSLISNMMTQHLERAAFKK